MTTQPLSGRRAIVTGGAGGLGRAFAASLVGAGARVATIDVADVADHDDGQLRGFRADLDPVGGRGRGVRPRDRLARTVSTSWSTTPGSPPARRLSTASTGRPSSSAACSRRTSSVLFSASAPPLRISLGHGGDIVNVVTDHVHTCWWPVPVDHAEAPELPVGGAAAAARVGRDGSLRRLQVGPVGDHPHLGDDAPSVRRPGQRPVDGRHRLADAAGARRCRTRRRPAPRARRGVARPGGGRAGSWSSCSPRARRGRSGDSVAVWPHHPVLLRDPAPGAGPALGLGPHHRPAWPTASDHLKDCDETTRGQGRPDHRRRARHGAQPRDPAGRGGRRDRRARHLSRHRQRQHRAGDPRRTWPRPRSSSRRRAVRS